MITIIAPNCMGIEYPGRLFPQWPFFQDSNFSDLSLLSYKLSPFGKRSNVKERAAGCCPRDAELPLLLSLPLPLVKLMILCHYLNT